MRMTVGPSQVDQVTLWLTRAEIADMIAALQALDDNFLEPGWHAHVQPEDGANLELTVAPGSIESAGLTLVEMPQIAGRSSARLETRIAQCLAGRVVSRSRR